MKSKQKHALGNQKIRLDIGCGFNKQPGFIGIDKRDITGVDIVHDIEVIPWPIDDNACAIAVMSHLIEHIKPWLQIDILNECWRVLECGGHALQPVERGDGNVFHKRSAVIQYIQAEALGVREVDMEPKNKHRISIKKNKR